MLTRNSVKIILQPLLNVLYKPVIIVLFTPGNKHSWLISNLEQLRNLVTSVEASLYWHMLLEVSNQVSPSLSRFSSCCQFCRLFASTVERCEAAALERLEANAKLKRQNFGSQSYSPPESSVSSSASATPQTTATLLQSSETAQEEPDPTAQKGPHVLFPLYNTY